MIHLDLLHGYYSFYSHSHLSYLAMHTPHVKQKFDKIQDVTLV